jgi:parallel beta-helix repeat protein
MEGQPITYLGDPNEQVIIKGSEVFSGVWYPVNEHPGVYFSEIPDNFFSPSFNPFKITFSKSRGGGTQGQVFIDGIELTEAKNNDNPDHGIRTVDSVRTKKEIMLGQENSWFAENGNKIYVHLPKDFGPIEKSTVEISVRRHLFAPVRRSQNYINIKGFIFEHCANDASFPQVGAVSCRSGQHWTIENNVIRNIKTIGLDFGAEDENPWLLPDILPEDRYLVSRHEDVFTLAERRIPGRHRILNNIVSDCGQCGIAGLFSDGTVIMGNTIERCGGVVPGFESGGIKVHGLMGGTVEANLVRDNESWGIWLDCGYIGSRVTRNVVVNNKISGIFFECSNGPGLIDNNVVAYNRGDGIYAHDASGITVANNLIFGNTNFGIYMCVAGDRLVPSYYYATGLLETELSACSWERISNNVFSGNEEGAISLPYPSARAQENLTDNNLFDEKQFTPRFVQHFRNGEPNTSELATNEARNAFSKSGDAGLSGADLVLWKNDKGISMNMTQWQLATGNDKNSLTGNVSCQLDLNTFELIVYLDEKLHQMDCKPVHALNVRDFEKFSREIDKDFLSKPMGSKIVLPGAFQNFKIGNNTIKIWPVEFEYPAMPPKVLIQPDPGAPGLMPIPPPDNRPGY